MKSFVVIFTLALGSCAKSPLENSFSYELYDSHYIQMAIPDSVTVTSTKFGSDCRSCYPFSKVNLQIIKSSNETLGQILMSFNMPIKDSLEVNNFSKREFQSLYDGLQREVGQPYFIDSLIISSVENITLNGIKSIYIRFDDKNAVIYQQFKHQRIMYVFSNFSSSEYMSSVIESIQLRIID